MIVDKTNVVGFFGGNTRKMRKRCSLETLIFAGYDGKNDREGTKTGEKL